MTKKEKILEKFKENPGSVSYKELEKILLDIGFEKIDAKGSHTKFKNKILVNDIIIPIHNNDCKEFYKKQTLKILNNNQLI